MDALRQWAQTTDPVLFLVAVALLLGAGLWSVIAGFGRWRRLRLVEDVPTSKIRSAAQGYVELAGTARMLPGQPVVAPLTGMHCVWYAYRVERRYRTGSGGGRRVTWRTVQSGVSDETFALEDGTGRCVVDPEGAEVHPAVTQVWEDSAPLSILAAGSLLGGLSGERYRYTEQRIHEGDPLYALGEFRTLSGADPGTLKEDVAALLRQWKRAPEHFLKPFDADGDGHIDLQEWEAARRAAERQALSERAERSREQAAVHLLAKPRLERLPFLLVAGSQHAVRTRLRLHTALLWVAGGCGVAAGLTLMALR